MDLTEKPYNSLNQPINENRNAISRWIFSKKYINLKRFGEFGWEFCPETSGEIWFSVVQG